MRNIYETLRHKEQQLKQLQQEVDALRLAAHLLAEDGEEAADAKNAKILSQPQMVRAVLIEAEQPLHVTKIVSAVKQKYGKKLKQAHLTALLYRYKKQGKLFYKHESKPNTFGLLEWQVKRNSPQSETSPLLKFGGGVTKN
jgi:hypothetical protein